MEDKIAEILNEYFWERDTNRKVAAHICNMIKQSLLDMVEIDTNKLGNFLIDIDYLNWNSTVIAGRIADHKSQILKLKEAKNG